MHMTHFNADMTVALQAIMRTITRQSGRVELTVDGLTDVFHTLGLADRDLPTNDGVRSELHASGFLKCVEAASYQPSERVFCRYLAACYIAESPELLQEMMVLKQRFYLFHKFLFAMLNEEQAYQACTLLIHNLQWPETLVDEEGFPVDEDGFVTKLPC
jgi:hypothetical protein